MTALRTWEAEVVARLLLYALSCLRLVEPGAAEELACSLDCAKPTSSKFL